MGKTLEECYEILGLEYGAKEDEIKSAYRKKALKCHPDKNPDDPLSTQKFQELGHAYRRLTGEEDSDEDDYDDDDMDIWRDFFFFLFRDEILARVRCKCSRCGRGGDQEDDDFLASLAKEQEEQYKFTAEEMAQFTCFANLKEQREANKKKFCDERKQSNIKPEQKATKGHKPKVKSNKQLKLEQWKREKEISEMAAQISQTDPKVPGKKASSKDAKTIDFHQQKSSYQHVVADRKKDVKEPPESSANKRNARKKKNRNKSKQHGDKETESSQTNGFMKTTLAEQKVASSFVVQDAVRNVTIKPETTKRQDEVTGRLPRYTRYTSPRMMKAQARVQDSAMSRQKNVLPEQTARGWFDNQKPATTSRASFGANIWQKRQEKQQFLAELQPSNQTDEELQLQLALELSKKQAEIDAQQREINLLERQVEETLQIEKQFQQITSAEETLNTAAAAVTDPDKFATAGIPHGCEPALNEVEEWGVASDSEDEWQESEQVSNFSDEDVSNDEENSFTIDEAEEPQHKSENHDLDEEHLAERSVSSGSNVSLTVPKSNERLAQLSRGQDSQDCCPYGKNCCLGKRCMYSHPPSVDNRKSQNFVDNTFSSDEKCDRSSSETACSPTGKHYSPVTSFEEVPGASDLSYPVDKPGQSYNALISNHKDASTTNESSHLMQPGSSVGQVPEAEDTSATEQSFHAGDSVPFGHMGGEGLSKDSYQCSVASGKRPDVTQSSWDNKTGLAPHPEDRSLSSQEKSKSTYSSDVQIHSSDHLVDLNADPGKDNGGGSNAVCQNPARGKTSTANSDVKSPTVYVIADQSQFPLGFPAASVVKQSVASLPPLVNLSAGAKLQNAPQTSQHSSSLPVSYVGQMPTGLPANLGAKTLTAVPPISSPVGTIPRTLSSASQNTASSSCSETPEAPAATQQQPISAVSSALSQGVTNGFPAIPGFPFLPFGNVFPFLNPANAAANASLMAAAGGGSGIPYPIIPGTSNLMPNHQGGQFVPPYLNMDLRNGVSPLAQYLPLQAQLNNLPGMTMEGNVPRPPPPQSQPQPQPQPSQTVVANNPQSAAPTVQQPFRFPFPFIDPQAFVNMNAAMAMGIPYSVLQNGCQTGLQTGTAPQLQALNKTTDPGRVLHKETGTTKPVEVKPDIGLERAESVSCGSKTPSLRRPATVPKVIQHQASKSS